MIIDNALLVLERKFDGKKTGPKKLKKKCMLAPRSRMEMTTQAMTIRRRVQSSLHLNGNQTEMKRSAVSKISVHEDTCRDRLKRGLKKSGRLFHIGLYNSMRKIISP